MYFTIPFSFVWLNTYFFKFWLSF